MNKKKQCPHNHNYSSCGFAAADHTGYEKGNEKVAAVALSAAMATGTITPATEPRPEATMEEEVMNATDGDIMTIQAFPNACTASKMQCASPKFDFCCQHQIQAKYLPTS